MAGRFEDFNLRIMNKTICEVFEELQYTIIYSIMIAVKCILCSAGTTWAAIQWKKQGVKWMNHANTKVLFCIYYGLVISIGASYSLLYAFDFRLFSSLHPKYFERWSERYWPALIIGASIVSLTFVSIYFAASHRFELVYIAKDVATIDLKIPENSKYYENIYDVLTYTFAGSAIIIGFDFYLNFYKNIREHGATNELVVKYQYSENRKVLATLLPLEITYAGMTLFGTGSQWIYNTFDFKFSFIGRALFVEGTALSPLYPLAFATIIEWSVARRKKHTIDDMLIAQQKKDHMTSLRESWQ